MRDEEAAPLWDAYFADRCEHNRNRLVEFYYDIIRLAAGPIIRRAPAWQPVDDLLGYGSIGLIQAVERFDPEQGVMFATFATRRIQGAIMDGQRSEDVLTRTARRKYNQIKSAMEGGHSDDPMWIGEHAGEVAEQTGIPEPETLHIIRWTHMAHFGGLTDDGKVISAYESDPAPISGNSEGDLGVSVDVMGLASLLAGRIARLSDQERLFLLLHYGDGKGLRDLQPHFGVSDSRLARVRQDIIRKIV